MAQQLCGALAALKMNDLISRREFMSRSLLGATALSTALVCNDRAAAGASTAAQRARDAQISDRIRDYIQQARQAALAELQPTQKQLERGLELHRSSIVCDTMGAVGAIGSSGLFSERMDQYARERLAETANPGYDVAMSIREELGHWRPFELVSDPTMQNDHRALWAARGQTLGMATFNSWTPDLIAVRTYVDDSLDHLEKVVNVKNLGQIKAQGRHAVLWHSHDRPILDESRSALDNLDLLRTFGLRWSQLTHGNATEFGGGQWSLGGPGPGLTDLGRAMVKRMNDLGIIPDPTHLSPEATLDMIEASDSPVIVSHTDCRAVHPGYCRYRNITDEAIKAVADKGGVVSICSHGNMTGAYTIEMFLRHIDHAVTLVGPDHVAVCTDSNIYLAAEPPELVEATKPKQWNTAYHWDLTLETVERKSNLRNPSLDRWKAETGPHALSACNWPYNATVTLACGGYSDEDVRKIIGGNVMRVAQPILNTHVPGPISQPNQL